MLARRLSQSSSEQTLPEVVYIFQCCNNLQDIQYDHAGIRLVASLVKLPLTISPWQGSTMSVSNPFGSELLWISVSVTAYLLYNDYDQGWQKMLQTFVKVPLYSSRAGAISSTACTGLHILFLLKRYPNLMSV